MRYPESLGSEHDPLLWWRGTAAGGSPKRLAFDVPRYGPDSDVLAALALVICRYSGQRSLVVDRGGSGHAVIRLDEHATVEEYRAAVRLSARSTIPRGDQPAIRVLDAGADVECVPGALTVVMDPAAGRLELCWPEGEFPSWLMRQIGRHLVHCHRQLVDSARQSSVIDDLRLQSPDEDREVLSLGRASRLTTTIPESIPAAFTRQASRTPDAIAVTGDGAELSYRELADWTDRLAGGLRTLGVEAGDRVGVLLGRSERTVAMLMAVMKAGAAYVPIASDTPAERLEFIAEDCGLRVVIVEDDDDRVRTACVSFLRLSHVPSQVPGRTPVSGADPAYVIYTSGSTGRPKGVVVPHRNVVSLITATRDEYGFGTADVWSWFHSAAFDFSVWEIWGCLLTGGRLVVVSDETRRSPDDFAELLRRENVTVLNQTPSSFAHLIDVDQRRPLVAAPRLVIFGGEPLDTSGLLRWFDRHAAEECRLVNMFGITETTVHVTAQDITRAMAESGSKSVGRPIPGWSVRVVDGRNRVLPLGAIGEIVVGGDGVALGYLNREDLTAERFVVDPWSGERLYRSGDLGFLKPDGTLEHLGRLDQQIKLRGHRIEPGEIRAALLADSRVVSAAVVVNRPIDGNRDSDRLDAYVVLVAGTADSATGEILGGCADRLPGYMVPTTLTAVPGLPLTANGKLDVTALPNPVPAAAGESPNSELESTVLSAWRSALGVQAVLDDHFFEIGGNSLLAARMIRQMRDIGLVNVSVRDVYLHPTPRRLAAEYRARSADDPVEPSERSR